MKNNLNNTRLGFGLMRLPKKLVRTDIDQVSDMVDLYMDAGFNYFDTAYVYPGSEKAIKQALFDRYPRESFTIASKLNAFMAPTEKAAKNQFNKSLERLGTNYFDFYLLHALMRNNYKRYDNFKIWDYLEDKKAQGKIRNLGFSFHSDPELLEQLLKEHPEIDFVQLQLNYADWDNPSVSSRANYEIARKYNKPIMVMEPIKGGKLANPPEKIKKLFTDYNPEASPASWALRFISSLDGVYTTLSGMSNTNQMVDNLNTMKNFKPLNEDEYLILREARKILGNTNNIECTSCRYCTENCPNNIPIPEIIKALNKHYDGQYQSAQEDYNEATSNTALASNCIECRQCENVCTQHLSITDYLKASVELFEN